jgi:hypothetical protein
MKRQFVWGYFCIMLLVGWALNVQALGETDRTVVYKVTHQTKAGALSTYAAYSIVAQEETGYWLQRTTSMQPDSELLSITQTLLDDLTHEPLRYIMHRPGNMDTPENVLDLPLTKMGQEEILPMPLTNAFAEAGQVQVPAGMFDARKGYVDDGWYWVSLDVPVLGVVKAERPEMTMELFRIEQGAVDLLPQKPPKDGIVYLNSGE